MKHIASTDLLHRPPQFAGSSGAADISSTSNSSIEPPRMKPNLLTKLLRSALSVTALAVTALAPAVQAGNHTWSGLGGNSLFSNPGNWSAGGVPEGREANVVLTFPASASNKNVIQDIESLGIDQIVIQGDGYFFTAMVGANYFLRGGAANDIENGSNNDTRFGLGATLVLNGDVTIHGSSGTVLIEASITGTGGLTVKGPVVEYAGDTVNTYTGLTRVENGTLRLNKEIGVGFGGDLEIGISLGADDNERVVLARNHQIPDAASVLIKPTGWLNLNGFSDTVGPMTLTGARVTTGTGTLTLAGNINVQDSDDFCSIEGKVNLGSGNRIITVATNASFDLLASVGGAAATSFSKQGPGGMFVSGANSFSAPFHINEGSVALFDSLGLGAASGHTYVHPGASLRLYGANVLGGETIHLSGQGNNGDAALVGSGFGTATLVIQGNIVLDGDATIGADTNVLLSIDGVISGQGGFTKVGPGTLWLEGNAPNTHTGTNRVNEGLVSLLKPAGMAAMAGPLVIGDDIGGLEADEVEWLDDQQLPANAVVTVRGSGFMNLHQQSQALGGLTLAASAQVAVNGIGVLTLPSLVSVLDEGYAPAGAPGMFVTGRINGTGRVHLAGPTTISTLWAHTIAPQITGAANAHLTKVGAGSLLLISSNSYAGLTLVKEGDINVSHPQALGAISAGTIVTNSGMLSLYHVAGGGEPLTLAGNNQNELGAVLLSSATNSWAGPITLATDSVVRSETAQASGLLRILGVISGNGKLIKNGTDPLELTGNTANTHTGETIIKEGDLLLNKTNAVAIRGALTIEGGQVRLFQAGQIHDSSSVRVSKPGVLNLDSHDETIGSLEGDGTVSTLLAALTTGGNNFTTTFQGVLGGIGFTTLIKEGNGSMMLLGDNSYAGRTLVNNGKLIVHGKVTSATIVAPQATLGGNGMVGVVTNNGIVNPGLGVGELASKSVTLRPGSTFRVELNGKVSYDRLTVTGAVNLVGCSLDTTIGFASSVGDAFTLIDNDGNDAVAGTFNFLPQNATFELNGQLFRISYAGGDGNDVVLTRANTPPSFSQLTATVSTNEGGTVHINGSIVDPDAGDAFAFMVNWGDGSPQQTVNLAAGTQSFHIEHFYADDKPGAQPSDSFTIDYTLTDSSGSPAFGQLNTVIGNVAPTVYAGGTGAVASGAALNSTLNFADPGSDSWTATVDYGDGGGKLPLSVGADKSLPMNHTFPSNGVYTVSVEVSDDDTGKGTGTFTVVVGLKLAIAKRNATELEASWPAGFNGCMLQTSPTISGTNWVNVPGSPSLLNNQWVQPVPGTNAAGFFRLNKP